MYCKHLHLRIKYILNKRIPYNSEYLMDNITHVNTVIDSASILNLIS